MKTEELVITAVNTNTIYMSESTAHAIRKTKVTQAGILFAFFRKYYPTAKVVCLTDEDFLGRFETMMRNAQNQFSTRMVVINQNSGSSLMHYQKIVELI